MFKSPSISLINEDIEKKNGKSKKVLLSSLDARNSLNINDNDEILLVPPTKKSTMKVSVKSLDRNATLFDKSIIKADGDGNYSEKKSKVNSRSVSFVEKENASPSP